MKSRATPERGRTSDEKAMTGRVAPLGSTFVVLVALLLGRLGGLIRELIVAPLFGASAEVDALIAARTVPDLILIVFTTGTINSVVVPALSHLSAGHDDVPDNAWQAVSAVCNWLLMLALGVTLIGLLFPQNFLALVTPGLDPIRVTEAARLLRIMLPMAVLATLGAIFGALLTFRERFGLPSSRAAIINASIIVSTLLFWKTLGIASVAVGWLVGALLQFLILVPLASRSAVHYRISLDFRVPGAKYVWGLMLPILVAQFLFYGRYFVERQFASWLPVGSLAQLNYAYRISSIPWFILANAVTTVYVTAFSKHSADNNLPSLLESLGQSLRIIAIGTIPCMVIFIGLAQPTIQILLQRGAFEASDTLAIAGLLQWYGISLLASSLIVLFSQVFYAMQDGITPVIALGTGVLLQWVSTAVLVPWFDTVGVVVGTCVGLFSTTVTLSVILKRKLPEVKTNWATSMLARVLYAGLGMFLVCTPLYAGLTKLVPDWPFWMNYFISIGVGVAVYMVIIWSLQVPEIHLVFAYARQRFGDIERSLSWR
jgi:putative peptidoglycan lipid II flippase